MCFTSSSNYPLFDRGEDESLITSKTLLQRISDLEKSINSGTPGAGSLKKENWTFTLEDGSTVTKAVYVG